MQVRFVQAAHELAHILHLTALALKIGDAFGLTHGIHQGCADVPLLEELLLEIVSEFKQVFPKLLALGAFSLEVGFTGCIGAFELAFIGEVELAAQGDEDALYVIAFFGFS